MVPLLLALLAQTPVDLPAASREPLTGTQPAVAYVGLQQYAVTWVDDRFDFLHRRRPTPSGATDLWYSRLSTDGGSASLSASARRRRWAGRRCWRPPAPSLPSGMRKSARARWASGARG